jgi:hypothetical protein
MILLCASGVNGRILFELAKLTAEVKQLRKIIERQAVTRPLVLSSVDEAAAIPEIGDGPVNSIEDCKTLLNSCGRKATQDYLVNTFFFARYKI